ncbi:MAG: hypothetical protein ACLFT9_20855 [Coleofasciculus sp.]
MFVVSASALLARFVLTTDLIYEARMELSLLPMQSRGWLLSRFGVSKQKHWSWEHITL